MPNSTNGNCKDEESPLFQRTNSRQPGRRQQRAAVNATATPDSPSRHTAMGATTRNTARQTASSRLICPNALRGLPKSPKVHTSSADPGNTPSHTECHTTLPVSIQRPTLPDSLLQTGREQTTSQPEEKPFKCPCLTPSPISPLHDSLSIPNSSTSGPRPPLADRLLSSGLSGSDKSTRRGMELPVGFEPPRFDGFEAEESETPGSLRRRENPIPKPRTAPRIKHQGLSFHQESTSHPPTAGKTIRSAIAITSE